MLAVGSKTPRHWTFAKQRMASFPGLAQLTQDGDEEGVFRLMRLPTPEEAAEIRRAAGVRQSTARPLLEGVSPPQKRGIRPLPFVLTSGRYLTPCLMPNASTTPMGAGMTGEPFLNAAPAKPLT